MQSNIYTVITLIQLVSCNVCVCVCLLTDALISFISESLRFEWTRQPEVPRYDLHPAVDDMVVLSYRV